MTRIALFLITAMFLGAAVASAATVTFLVPLDGDIEVPAPGDPDGFGLATLTIDDVALTIDWAYEVNDIDPSVFGVHIHRGIEGQAGPVVVDFGAELFGFDHFDADLAAILADPAGYYANVHNLEFPQGALRGQIPEPAMISLLAVGLLPFLRRSEVRGRFHRNRL